MSSLEVRLQRQSDVDFKDVLEHMGTVVVNQTLERFETQIDPEGNEWAPWSRRYANSRHGNHSLLNNEGSLRNSIELYDLSDDSVLIGSDMNYASKHQLGEGVPQRAFLGVNDANEIELELEFGEYLRDYLGI